MDTPILVESDANPQSKGKPTRRASNRKGTTSMPREISLTPSHALGKQKIGVLDDGITIDGQGDFDMPSITSQKKARSLVVVETSPDWPPHAQ